MKKATSKRERKYGKKESDELEKLKPKVKEKTTKKEPIEMYKILIDRTSFTPPMPYEKCVEFINNKNKEATKVFRKPPLMSLVKV